MPKYLFAILLATLILAVDLAIASTTFTSSTLTAEVGGVDIPVYLYKPAGRGPFPLIVLSHGSPPLLKNRLTYGSETLEQEALAFVDSGAAVAVPIRRGFGGHGKVVDEYKHNCSRPNYYDVGLVIAQDVNAAIKATIKDPDIDGSRVVLVGHSVGGFASVAAGAQEKVLGVVSFAGGNGSVGTDKVNCEGNLISAMKMYGHSSHTPELWIYSSNDHFFGPRVASELHDAFVAGGGQATLVSAPPYGDDGHAYIHNVKSWKPEVDAYLQQIHFLH